jgi:hypothetical protein
VRSEALIAEAQALVTELRGGDNEYQGSVNRLIQTLAVYDHHPIEAQRLYLKHDLEDVIRTLEYVADRIEVES